MRLSILIVNWRTSDLLRRLLESLERYAPICEHEVIVVDNGSDDFDLASFRAGFPRVVFLPQSSNLGFAQGNNLAFEQSSGDLLVLLNPDTEVTDGSLDALIEFLESHPRAGIVAPQLVFPDGRIQASCRGFPWPASLAFAAAGLPRLFPGSRLFGAYRMTWFDHNHTMPVDQPMASCWALRRSLVNEIGFLDPAFANLFNDVDFAWRVREAGREVWFCAEARVIHVGGQGTAKAGKDFYRQSHEGLVRFYEKDMKGRSPAAALWLGRAISLAHWKLKVLRYRGSSL